MTDTSSRYIAAAAGLVQAYVANNHLPASDVSGLVRLVHGALLALTDRSASEPSVPDYERPDARAIRRSIKPDGIVSFLDGRTYSTLKRHLTASGFNPKTYRKRYGLPDDYPMVALAYSERRSRIAKDIGLGVVRGEVVRDGGRIAAEPRSRLGKRLQPT